jgi:hypothetical protein
VTVEGIGGDIFYQLKIYDVLEFMFAKNINQQNNELGKVDKSFYVE